MEPSSATRSGRVLIERWGRLHAGRSALGALATGMFVWAALERLSPNV